MAFLTYMKMMLSLSQLMNLRLNYHTQLFLKHVRDKKMEALALMAYPDYTASNGFVGRYVKIWIGDLYKNEPCYICLLYTSPSPRD